MKIGDLCLAFIVVLVLLVSFTSSFQGNSSSYSADTKIDSFAETNSTSTSYSSRLIGGIAFVGEYLDTALSGRFGILEDNSSLSLTINITSPENNDEVVRGGSDLNEDDKDLIASTQTLTARVFDSSASGFSGANCFFYDSATLIANASTNSSGYCSVNYTKSSLAVGQKNILANYTITTSDTKLVEESRINISLTKYITSLTMGNLRSGGVYYNGDIATLSIAITKTNSSGTFYYDPQNITANATNSAGALYFNGSSYYPGNITKTGTGLYSTSVVTNSTFGNFIRWDVRISDDNFQTYLSTALHADEQVCAGDFGAWGAWSACVGGTQTRTRTDSTGCSEVESQTCGGGGGCIPSWSTWSDWSECIDNQQTRTRDDGCGNVEIEIKDCDFIDCTDPANFNHPDCICTPDWKCSWTACEEDETGNYYSYPYNCIDLNNCPISELPEKKPCTLDDSCNPIWDCGEWSECSAEYNIKDVLAGRPTTTGIQSRVCKDTNECESNFVETTACSLVVPIRAEKTSWCYEDYVELYDLTTNSLVARIKEKTGQNTLDIDFKISELEGYCSYCYDGVKNYDEEDTDCGGQNCPTCKKYTKYTDYFLYLRWALWILLLLLVLYLIWKNRKRYTKFKKSHLEINTDKLEKKILSIIKSEKTTSTAKPKRAGFISRISRTFKEKRAKRKQFKRERKVVRKEAKVLKKRIRRKEVSRRELSNLRRKLNEWRAKGYYRTTGLLKRLDKYERKGMYK